MKKISNPTALLKQGLIDTQDLEKIEAVAKKFSISITGQVNELLESCSAESFDGIAKQFVPDAQELTILDEELSDPIGDFHHMPVKGIVHRHRDRCLLKIVNICAVYCRFCFRREHLGPGSESLNVDELEKAYAYIEAHPEIWEVILTGGDPLLLSPKKIAKIIKRLQNIPQVEIIRIHTRIPMVDSIKINDAMIKALSLHRPLYIALHANHPKEFTPEAIAACAKLADAGIPLLGQSVLLKGINDDPETLGELMKNFVRNRIKPYYLHHPDLAKGTSHFRPSLEAGKALMRQLRQDHSGLCQATYVIDTPKGLGGKQPVMEMLCHGS